MNTCQSSFKKTENIWISIILDIRLLLGGIFTLLYVQEKLESVSCAMVGYRQPGHLTPFNIIIPFCYVVSLILASFLVLFSIFCVIRTIKNNNSAKFVWFHIAELLLAMLAVFILLTPTFITEKTITTKDFVIEQEENAAAVLGLTRDDTIECAMAYDRNAQYSSHIGSHVVCVIPQNCEGSYYYDSESDTIYSSNASSNYYETINSAIADFCEKEDVKSSVSLFGCYATYEIASHNDPSSEVAAGEPVCVTVIGFPIDKASLDLTGKTVEKIIGTPSNATLTDFTIQITKNNLSEKEMNELREYLLKKIEIATDVMFY